MRGLAASVVLAVLWISTAAAAELVGTYDGTWSGVRPGDQPVMKSNLVVESVEGDKAKGEFIWEDAPAWQVKAGRLKFNGEVKGKELSWVWNGKDGKKYEFWFAVTDDGALDGGRWVDGKQTGKVVFRKQ